MNKGRKTQRLQFSYLTDELGHIVETREATSGLDPSFDITLGQLRKPLMPIEINTPEKKAAWFRYWDAMESWWESERSNEKRERW